MLRKLNSKIRSYIKVNISPSGKGFYFSNIENETEFFISKAFWLGRKEGISAMMRLKNDEKWIKYAILSIADDVDEIIVTLQNSTDKTEEIIRDLEINKIKIYHYPFDSYPNQPNYAAFPADSVYNRAYFYNWSLSKTNYSWVWKWDGDHAAFDGSAKFIKDLALSDKYDIIHYKGIDIYGSNLKYVCKTPFCGNEPAIFRVTKRTFYFPGDFCEEFSYPVWRSFFSKSRIFNIPEPQFLHFKYAVPVDNLGKGWPENWKELKFFQDLTSDKSQGEEYKGTYPKVLKDYLKI